MNTLDLVPRRCDLVVTIFFPALTTAVLQTVFLLGVRNKKTAVFARPMFDVSSHQIFNVLSIARFTHFAKKTCLMFISKIVTQEWYSIFDSTQQHTLTRSTVVQYRKDTCFVERMNEQ